MGRGGSRTWCGSRTLISCELGFARDHEKAKRKLTCELCAERSIGSSTTSTRTRSPSSTEDVHAQHPSDDIPSGWLGSPSQLGWSWMPLSSFSLLPTHLHPASSSSNPPDRLTDIAESSSSLPRSKRTPATTTPANSIAGKRRAGTPDPPSPTRVSLAAGRISPLQGGRVSPTTARGRRYPSETEDVDPHPTPSPSPSQVCLPPSSSFGREELNSRAQTASAFAIYRNAHRYSLHALASLALAQVVQGLTPKTAFPLLLATHLWPELHGAIKVASFPLSLGLGGTDESAGVRAGAFLRDLRRAGIGEVLVRPPPSFGLCEELMG